MTETLSFTLFNTFVLAMLLLDLFVFHRNAHEVSIREALGFSAFWIGLALSFNVLIYYTRGRDQALEFLAGYLIEKSLSVDNIFVFIMIFSYFKVAPRYQHKILFWGIMGALVLRGIFIATGVALIQRFSWMLYIFGGFLVVTGLKMAFQNDEGVHPEKNPVLRLCQKFIPMTNQYDGDRFFTRINGRKLATPLLIVLIIVETTDVVFALDSIPAILAISRHPFIVYTSNVFAILGLRALYFAMAGLMGIFHYLKFGLAAILCFIGVKMILSHHYHVPIEIALGVVGGILAISVIASLIDPRGGAPTPPLPPQVA